MRRRLATAIVGLVVAALALAGLGTILLATLADREDAEADLRNQVESIGELLGELTFAPTGRDDDETLRQRLRRVAESMSVDGIGLLVLPRDGVPIGELPGGITVDDLDIDALQEGQTVSGRSGDLIWAAHGQINRIGVPQLLVLTTEADRIVAPAFRWFLVAAVVTVGLSLVVTARLSRRLTDPIREASGVTGRLAAGELGARIPVDAAAVGDEVGDLITSINAMADSLERANTLERQFLMSVSHDLRTPLTSIKGYAEALADGAIDDATRAGAVIESEAARLERLVGDLLLLARLGSTDFPLHPAVVDPASTVASVVEGLGQDADDRGLHLGARLADAPYAIEVDPDRLAQIVANLVSNALRFAATEVTVSLHETDGWVHLAVGDDGPGIDDVDLPYVFERLYMANATPAVKESGGGLGLAIVRDLTERMGGVVEARRSRRGGAEFVVSLRSAR